MQTIRISQGSESRVSLELSFNKKNINKKFAVYSLFLTLTLFLSIENKCIWNH